MRLLITGTFSNHTRIELNDTLKAMGAKLAPAISSKLDYVIVGTEPGLAKITEAKKLKLKEMHEKELYEILSKHNK